MCVVYQFYPTYLIQRNIPDPLGIIRNRKPKDRQYNGQKKKDKRTNNDLHNITQKIKDLATRTPLKTDELRCSEKVSSSYSTCGTHRVFLSRLLICSIVHWCSHVLWNKVYLRSASFPFYNICFRPMRDK